jgi:hypothetical protein
MVRGFAAGEFEVPEDFDQLPERFLTEFQK